MKIILLPHILLLILLSIVMAVPPVFSGETFFGTERAEEDTGPMAFALKIFRKTISRADGRRCMMYPSCSHYSGQAFEKHGFIKGWVMTTDRLLRCGRDEKRIAEAVVIDRQAYVYDPLERNDFWWARP